MNLIRVSIRVTGRVQGVGYRQFTHTNAQSFAVCGWVKNLPDGDVAAVIEGEEDAVRGLISCCHQGPTHALVEKVSIAFDDHTGEFDRFSIRA